VSEDQLLFNAEDGVPAAEVEIEDEDGNGNGSEGGNGLEGQSPQDGPLRRLIDDHFIQYASYVIRDRAIPDLADGLKPVQRRILWSLKEQDDGNFSKVANVVGHCMQYHPHGDAAITDALVVLANKVGLIEGQGNFGNIHTGDPAAASRYIECRLTKMAREELFNDHLTTLVPNYDGRRKEPVTLPCKLPLLLMLGAEGIAVGLSTKILPHNLKELLEAQIAILQKQPFRVYPDFQQGGTMDVSEYDKGNGRVRVRAKIEMRDEQTLVIREIPFGTTTESVMASIEAAAHKKKIKIKAMHDFTAEAVEVEVALGEEQDATRAVQALYAFTQCEVPISARLIVIDENRPVEMDVDSVLQNATRRLVSILKRELGWRKRELEGEIHRRTLVQIFVENRIYKRIEDCKTFPEVQTAVRKGFDPFVSELSQPITEKDVEMLLAIAIKRISRFDIERSRKEIEDRVKEIGEIEKKLGGITRYAIQYLRGMIRSYASEVERRTQIETFKDVEIRKITEESVEIRYDAKSGYFGTEIKGENLALTCSSYDKVLCVWNDGGYKVIAPPERLFVDDNLIYVGVAERNHVLTMVYEEEMFTYLKRFKLGGTVANRAYRGAGEGSKVLYFSDASPKTLYVKYHKAKRLRILEQEFDLESVVVKSAKTRGNQMSSKKIRLITDARPRGWKDDPQRPRGRFMDA